VDIRLDQQYVDKMNETEKMIQKSVEMAKQRRNDKF
jgi:hypothetical protein